MRKQFEESGFIKLVNYFSDEELFELEQILNTFHQAWLIKNKSDYENGSVNSYSLTAGDLLNRNDVLKLFQFISQNKVVNIVNEIFAQPAIFLNTQLFFDPFDSRQNNYWHRDIQYLNLPVEEQKETIKTQNVIHFRIPLKKENGIELIPASHKQWDNEEEFAVRMKLKEKKPSDNLSRGRQISLEKGDLLVFSANMIHRGIYGKDRFAFDVIFFDDTPEFRKIIDSRNLPVEKELHLLGNSKIFPGK